LVVIAGLTGGVIGWQSWETRKAASAASKSADAQMTADRAWLLVQSIDKITFNPVVNVPKATFAI